MREYQQRAGAAVQRQFVWLGNVIFGRQSRAERWAATDGAAGYVGL